MESVRGVNVPMYTTLRRTTVVFTMIVEYILAGQRYTSPVVGRLVAHFLLFHHVYADVRDSLMTISSFSLDFSY